MVMSGIKIPKYAALLAAILQDREKGVIYPCIQDLLNNSLSLDRFSDSEIKPQRQDITQYMAAWAKHIGLEKEECTVWLVEYCQAMLSSISKTSLSGIRHSTKSNIKYIYKSDVQFLCKQEDNPFKALCSRECPVYAQMKVKRALVKKNKEAEKAAQMQRAEKAAQTQQADVIEEQYISVKEMYRDQFNTALQFIHDEIKKNTPRKKILRLLDQKGLKTKTGRKWKYGSLQTVIKQINDN